MATILHDDGLLTIAAVMVASAVRDAKRAKTPKRRQYALEFLGSDFTRIVLDLLYPNAPLDDFLSETSFQLPLF